MAYDKVVDSSRLDGALTATADAIRGKTGSADGIQWDADTGFAAAVDAITTGGGEPVQPKEVNFYDYDGTLLYAYTVAEAQALDALPEGPSHEGLVFQGWNWPLEGVKALTRPMDIGATHITDDGTTRLYITLQEGRTSPMLGVGVNGTVSVDWGDGAKSDILTGTNINTTQWTPTHAYDAPGNYVIRMKVTGKMRLIGTSQGNTYSCILRHSTDADVRNKAYQTAVKRVEVGEGVTEIGDYAFYYCSCLSSITIPDNVNIISTGAFLQTAKLEAIVFPSSITRVFSNAFHAATRIVSVVLPYGLTTLDGNAFYGCRNLVAITVPDSVTNLGSSVFSDGSIVSIIIPSGVSVVKHNLFINCGAMRICDFTEHVSVPTLENTSAFTGVPTDCEIRVPTALYDEWITATNWAAYADQIKAY